MEEKPTQISPPGEPNNQNSQVQLSKSENLILVVKIIAVVLAIGIGSVVGYFLGSARGSQKESLPQQSQPTTLPQANQQTPTPVPIPSGGVEKSTEYWKKKLLLEKDYGNFKIGAYDISDFLGEVFIVAPIENDIPTTYNFAFILSYASNAFFRDNLFEIVGENIYVLNQEGSFIDVYQVSFSEKTLATPSYYRVKFIESIEGPKYAVGAPYSIKCQGNLCQIETAHHQQSGCSMELDLGTKQYSNIKCSRMGGEFSPEPL